MAADNVIDTLAIEIESNATNSVEGVKRLSSALRSLANSTAKVNSANLNNVVTQLDKLQGVAGRTGTQAQNASKGTRNFSNSLTGLHSRSSKASGGMKSLAYHFGKFYANCFLAIRGVKALGKATSSAMDYIEGFNFFDVAIGKATSSDWEQAGYDSAESYRRSFENSLGNINSKLTGFNVDNDTGNFTPTGMKNLGLDIGKVQQFQAEVVSLTNALGLLPNVSQNAADGLTRLAGDMSSLKNVDLSKVMADFQSGLLGQSRALYKYGIDITNATLKQYALANGVSKSVSEMTQGEKAQLRLLAIMDQSKVAWGDLANTINQPANQLRMFTTGVKNLALTIGKILMPMVTGVLPYLNAMVIALQRFFSWIASIAGIEIDNKNTGAGTTDIFDNIEDDADNAKDSVDDLNKSMKELNKQLAPFDELNNMTTSSNKGSSSSGSGAGSAIDLSDAINKAFDNYFKVWDNAYAKSVQKANEMADAIVNAFKKGDYKAIGTYISTNLTNALNSIPWDKIYSVASNFGKGFAEFLNGLITPQEFYAVGQTLAGVLNTVVYSSLSFASTFDWSNFGNSIASGINGVFENFDFGALGQSVSKWALGLLKAMTTAIKEVDWANVGTQIGTFFSNIDWAEAIGDLHELIEAIAKAIVEGMGNWFAEDSLSATIVTGLGVLKLTGASKKVGELLSEKLSSVSAKVGLVVAAEGLSLFFDSNGFNLNSFVSPIMTGIGATLVTGGNWQIGIAVSFVLQAANTGLSIGNYFAGTDYTWEDIFPNLTDMSWWSDLAHYAYEDFVKGFFEGTGEFVEGIFAWVGNLFVDFINGNVIPWVNDLRELFGMEAIEPLKRFGEEAEKSTKKHKQSTDETSKAYKGMGAGVSGALNGLGNDLKNGKSNTNSFYNSTDYATKKAKIAYQKMGEGVRGSMNESNTSINSTQTKIGSLSTSTSTRTSSIMTAFANMSSRGSSSLLSLNTAMGGTQTKISGLNGTASIGSSGIVTAFRNLLTGGKSSLSGMNTAMGGTQTKMSNFKSTSNSESSAIKRAFSAFATSAAGSLRDTNSSISGTQTKMGGIKTTWANLKLPAILANIKLPHISVDWKDYGKFSLPSLSVKYYAKGGFPEAGNMFVAGEAGAEMVGNINGRTGVASNMEITGIREAVYDAGEAQLVELKEQNALLRQLLAKDMGISSRAVFNAVRDEDENYSNMTGHSAFAR